MVDTRGSLGTCTVLCIVVTACGGGGGGAADAGGTDAAPDASVNDASVDSAVLDGSIADAGNDAAPFTGTDHPIDTSSSTFDCADNDVQPGDRVTIQGTSRGPLRINNCIGTPSQRITIRNDVSLSGPLAIARTSAQSGNFIFNCHDCVHVNFDGSGKWAGAPAGTCGVSSWAGHASVLGTDNCGIRVTTTANGDSPSIFVRFGGTSRHVTIKGVEVDGVWPALAVNGIGIGINDHDQNLTDPSNPGGPSGEEWREGVIIEHVYIHGTEGEAIYFGPNYNTGGADDWKLRNNEIRYSYTADIGYDCISMKSTIAGYNHIHHNYVDGCGLTGDPPSTGNSGAGIDFFEGGGQIYNNFVTNTLRAGLLQGTLNLPLSWGPLPSDFYNNVVVSAGDNGINVYRQDSADAMAQPTLYNNTIISPAGQGIATNSTLTSCEVRDNIIADAGGSPVSGPCTDVNNLTGTVSSMQFTAAGAGDYSLAPGSPAIDTGGSSCPATDHLDAARPAEGGCERGAYEFHP